MKISVIGLGKIGSVILGLLANAKHEVIGVDPDERISTSLMAGKPPFEEPGLKELLATGKNYFSLTDDIAEAVSCSDISIIIVPTPSNKDGSFSNEIVLPILEAIARAIVAKNSYHLIVLKSTVSPGSCVEKFLPLMQEIIGEDPGRLWGFAYNPEFIALGNIIENMTKPELTLIGVSDEIAANKTLQLAAAIAPKLGQVRIMDSTSAELVKIGINTFVTMKISFANFFGELANSFQGANASIVNEAIGVDSRVGNKYLKAGLGYAGPCFPRDNRALQHVASEKGFIAHLALAADTINTRQPELVTKRLSTKLNPGSTVTISGIAYKENTDVTDESQALKMGQLLTEQGISVFYHDIRMEGAMRNKNEKTLKYAKGLSQDLKNCLAESDALVICNSFGPVTDDLLECLKGKMVFDIWGSYPNLKDVAEITYV